MKSDVWSDDRLGRGEEAEMLRLFLVNQAEVRKAREPGQAFVLNLDSEWGAGKTFFLNRFGRHLEANGHVAVYVDAWKSDYLDDPFIVVFSEIKSHLEAIAREAGVLEKIEQKIAPVKSSFSNIVVRAAIGGAKQALNRLVGEEAGGELLGAAGVAVIDELGDKFIESFNVQKEAIERFRVELGELAAGALESSERPGPIFVLIDELDRCRPTFAINLLERVKHLFSTKEFVFVVATDTSQLAHAVAGVYGGRFNGTRYLKKFFDRTYRFQSVSIESFVDEQVESLSINLDEFASLPGFEPIEFLRNAFITASLPLRDINRMMEKIQTFRGVWPYGALKIQLPYLLPLLHEEHLDGEAGQDFKSQIRQMKALVRRYDERVGKYTEDQLEIEKLFVNVERFGENIFYQKDYGPGGGIERWLQEIFVPEKEILHNNIARQTPTVLFDYLRLMRQVSAFKSN